MATITLQYDARNAVLKKVFDLAISLGAIAINARKPSKTAKKQDDVLNIYQQTFGKREGNKYSENEIFLVNSKLNAAKSFAKYL